MISRKNCAAAFVIAAAMTASLLPPAAAQTGTTYDLQIGADFSRTVEGQRIPGFSLRFYPSSLTIHKGDTLHYSGFGLPLLHQEGEHPAEWQERERVAIGDRYFDLVRDPDEGDDAYKFNDAFEQGTTDCTSAADPCEWDGRSAEILNPGFVEEGWVTITANPGDVIYASFAEGSYQRIEVVPEPAPASTQEELDRRAAQMIADDYNDLAALHRKMSAKSSYHVTPNGKQVWDAWAGVDRGPLGLDAMYPKRLKIVEGQTVQWHFDLDFNAHTVTIPRRKAFKRIVDSYGGTSAEYGPVCDPDGDDGTAPDTLPTGQSETDPPCPDGQQFEFDLNPLEIFESGNGVYKGGGDFEHSGVRTHDPLQEGFFDHDSFNVRFKKPSGRNGYAYMCTIHGRFMSGKVVVRKVPITCGSCGPR